MHDDSPSLETLYSVRPDGSRRKIHTADVRGRFMRARLWVFRALIGIMLALPLVPVGGHPAVHLDIDGRHFYLFGTVFNATDVWMGVFVLTGGAFLLLFITAWLGRAWCGWACPQTVFLEGVYRRIERWIDGPRDKRLRREAAPMDAGKLARVIGKQTAYVIVSFLIAHSFVAYFVSVPGLITLIKAGPWDHTEAFMWAMGMTVVLYFNFAWFREQFCIVLCPYGRMQSVLVDKESLVIGYDQKRGEPRGKAGKTSGDCVDCNRCVVVCPTGIDIRNGLQMECVACAQCVDACDEVMVKLHRPRGLVRYGSQREIAGEGKRRLVRGRLVAYAALTLLALGGVVLSTRSRVDVEARLLRGRGAPYTVVTTDDGSSGVRNQYELHLTNKLSTAATFDIRALVDAGAQAVVVPTTMTLAPLESRRIPVVITYPDGVPRPREVAVEVTAHREGDQHQVTAVARARFLAP